MFGLKNLTKKIAAYVTAATIGVSAVFMPMSNVQAISVSDVIGIAIGASQMNQYRKQADLLNNTEEGRQQLFQHFKDECKVNDDYYLNSRLDTIMANLTSAVAKIDPSVSEKPYLYFISQETTLNAACSMGHVMMVNTGAFTHLSSDDEIAAVVGHEMGHGQKDHVVKSIKDQMNKTLIAQVAASAIGGNATTANISAIVLQIALKHTVAHGNRKHETEADNLAWEYLLNTNYNLGAGAAVMQKLWELSGEKNHGDFFNPSDHPNTDKRRDNYVKKLEEYSGKHVTAKDGVVLVNGRAFMTVAAANGMSSAERAYFVLGNLAAAYHNGQNTSNAKVNGNIVLLGNQPIVEVASGDEDAYTLAERLNALK